MKKETKKVVSVGAVIGVLASLCEITGFNFRDIWGILHKPEKMDSEVEEMNTETYEEIYGSLIFDYVDNTKRPDGMFSSDSYLSTGYQIHKYYLADMNADGIKELMLQISMTGTDEQFRVCYTFENGTVQWCGSYSDIYLIDECYLSQDTNGMVVISNAGEEVPMGSGYVFHWWNPLDDKSFHDKLVYVSEFPQIGVYFTDVRDFLAAPTDIPDSIRSKLGDKLEAFAPTCREPLQEHLPL